MSSSSSSSNPLVGFEHLIGQEFSSFTNALASEAPGLASGIASIESAVKSAVQEVHHDIAQAIAQPPSSAPVDTILGEINHDLGAIGGGFMHGFESVVSDLAGPGWSGHWDGSSWLDSGSPLLF